VQVSHYKLSKLWHGGLTVNSLDSQPRGLGFDSQLRCHLITTPHTFFLGRQKYNCSLAERQWWHMTGITVGLPYYQVYQ